MKKLLMIVAMMVATLSANAQNEVGQITLKPMAGMTLATITDFDNVKMKAGLVAGVEAEYGISENFGITGGVLYSMQGCKAKEGDGKMKLDYINVPVLANYYIIPGLAVKAGLQPGFKVRGKWKTEANGQSTEGDFNGGKSFDLSIPFGISYEFSNFVIDGRYQLGLTDTSNGGSSKNSVFMFSVGYKFSL